MSIFSKILEKLGLRKKDAESSGTASGGVKPAAGPPKPTAAPAPTHRPSGSPDERDEVHHGPTAAPVAISEVDVVKKLEGLAAAQPLKLNWKTSIADLLFLLGIENSYEARKELATELGCPPELMHDSAKMNTWLHKEVLRQIAQNGGNIPKELLD